MQPAHTDLVFQIEAGGTAGGPTSYVDTARSLSRQNRRLYEQGRMYAYQGLTFIWRASAAPAPNDLASIEVKLSTAGNTWTVHNAFVKGKALWHEMQDLVLDDNPSIAGTWRDYKVKLDYLMTTGRILDVMDSSMTEIKAGEWDYSTYVMPQHEVNPATGEPLAAEEFVACLIGEDVSSNKALVKAYEESRATVQPEDPNVPAGMSTSFFNLLTDSGSQEPELADVIEDENDEPPYDVDEYVGSDTNAKAPLVVGYAAISPQEVDGKIGGFIAPCGLIQIEVVGYNSVGAVVDDEFMPEIDMILHVAPGMYKGVASVPMGQ